MIDVMLPYCVFFLHPSLFVRNEFKAYADVKPVKPIKAKPQYAPPVEEKASLETSYSATFRGEQVQNMPTDNKTQEHRRIRSLYSEPGKEPIKVGGMVYGHILSGCRLGLLTKQNQYII